MGKGESESGCFTFKTLALVTFVITVFECIAGLACGSFYLLYYNCVIKVNNDGESLGQVIYLKYIVGGGQCTWKDSDVQVARYNPNDLTKSDNIVIWQIVYIVLYLFWIITASVIPKSLKRPNLFLAPWIFVTGLMIMADLIFTILSLTDLGKDIEEGYPEIFNKHQDMSIVCLVLYSCKAGVFWLINVVLLVWVLNFLIVNKEKSDNGSLWTDKNFDDIKNELSSVDDNDEKGDDTPDGVDNSNDSDHEMTTEFRENEAPKSAYTPQTIPHHTYADPQQGQHHNRRQNGADPLNGYVINPGGHHRAAYDNNGYLPDNRHSEGGYNPGSNAERPPQAGYKPDRHNIGYQPERPNDRYQRPDGQNSRNQMPESPNGRFPPEKPKSFKDKIKETKENKRHVGAGGAYAYIAETPVLPHHRKGVPVQDVDSAFGFLSSYERQGSRGGPENGSEASLPGSNIVNGRRVYSNDEEGPFYIPKMKI